LDGASSLRARLVDVNSGVSYPVTNLNELPDMLWRLLRRMFFRLTPGDPESPENCKP